jgi:hypothetical protein
VVIHLKYKIFVFTLMTVLLTGAVFAATPDGSTGPWADSVIDEEQGSRWDGTPVVTDRSDSTAALGDAETSGGASDSGFPTGSFYSLGFGGWITLEFENSIVNEDGDDLMVYEVTGGSYPIEKVEVEASVDGNTWVYLGEVSRDDTLDLGELACAHYVRITDTTDESLFNTRPTADAYDLDAVEALHWSEDTCGPAYDTPWEHYVGSQGYWRKNAPESAYEGFAFVKKVKGNECNMYGNQLLAFLNNWDEDNEEEGVSFQELYFDSEMDLTYDGWTVEEIYDYVTAPLVTHEECNEGVIAREDLLELKDVLDWINNGEYLWY